MEAQTDVCEWSECFEKFYISKKDSWSCFKATFLEFYNDVDHLLAVDKESSIPPGDLPTAAPVATTTPPETPTPTAQKQIVGPAETPSRKKPSGPASKPKRLNNQELFKDLKETQVFRGAGSNVKRRGQPFQKGTCFSAIIFGHRPNNSDVNQHNICKNTAIHFIWGRNKH